jgi:hypothetical protein
LASLVLAASLLGASAAAPSSPAIAGVGAIGITVSDLDGSVAFYTSRGR